MNLKRRIKKIDRKIDSILDNWFGGHIRIGKMTIFGRNAMHYGVNIRTKKWGCICFRLPFTMYNNWFPLYFYLSPNGTPWASTLYYGNDKREKRLSKLRKEAFGHGFNYEVCREDLRYINNYEKLGDNILRSRKLDNILD